MEENLKQKQAIGRLAAAIMLGRPVGKGETPFNERNPLDKLEELQAFIWKSLDGPHGPSHRVRTSLAQFWEKRHRLVAMDAGTTTHCAAEYVANPWGLEPELDEGLPRAGALCPNINSFDPRTVTLRVLTNCPRIERCMESPRSFPSVVSLGGALRKDTLARTGILAERSYSALDIRPDVCMLGTTSLRTEQGFGPMGFACDSEDEGRTKSLMLEADLRCVLMDSAKVQRYRSSAFTFAVCSSKCLDLVITDAGITEMAAKEHIDMSRLWGDGVAVLIAEL